MCDVAEEKSKKIVRLFLQDMGEIYSLKLFLTNLYKKILYIQQIFRDHLASFQHRCEVLGEIWEHEKTLIIKDCIIKKNKKKQVLMKKLNIMSDDIKDAMIKAYMDRCKLKYQLNFAEWRLHTKYVTDLPEHQKQVSSTECNKENIERKDVYEDQ